MSSIQPPNNSDSSSPSEKSENAAGRSRQRSIWTNFRFLGFLGFFLIFMVPLGFHYGIGAFFFACITFVEVVVLFNILIIVHELGHFLAAKWCGLKIEKFAIWFGKPIWSKRIDGIDYILGSIPAGGYVALPQMANPDSVEGKSETPLEDMPPASPGQKIIVAFAGPLFSFGLAFVFACIVWMVGKPVGYSEGTTTIGYAIPGGPAAKAGVQAGDVIQNINGQKISRWIGVGDGVTWNIITSTQVPMTLDVLRDGKPLTFKITPELDPDQPQHWWQRATPPRVQITPAEKDIIIEKVLPYSPAAIAGFQKGDRLIAMNGVPLFSDYPLYQSMKTAPDAAFTLTAMRGSETLTKTVQPVKPISPKDLPKDGPQTDIGIEFDNNADVVQVYPTPWNQISESVNMVRSTLTALFTPHSNVGPSQLSGPVGIMNLFFAILSSDNGWKIALWFAVVINVNLAILNLLPFPILDGGHILLSVIEWIRRRPLSMTILEPLQTAFALLLMGYMAYITFFDVQDSGRMVMNAGDDTVQFAPKSGTP